ncbi:hypothetical protein Avi_0125 [Allorhizobium ampelinum S4]|uniref:Uncharacterized protein n=1 Tax=Allorhizobium ampelinum (strain ATCC BAA-846 / DSM 112012 / S4) TaxID=311402 RepID=B9JYH3_ALLAM|nr:hypothetical protein Avi_0125 [Allorhizobium ampelinum S4]
MGGGVRRFDDFNIEDFPGMNIVNTALQQCIQRIAKERKYRRFAKSIKKRRPFTLDRRSSADE